MWSKTAVIFSCLLGLIQRWKANLPLGVRPIIKSILASLWKTKLCNLARPPHRHSDLPMEKHGSWAYSRKMLWYIKVHSFLDIKWIISQGWVKPPEKESSVHTVCWKNSTGRMFYLNMQNFVKTHGFNLLFVSEESRKKLLKRMSL